MRVRTAAELETTQGAHKFRTLLNDELRNLGHRVTDWSSKEPFDVVLSRGPLLRAHLDCARSVGAKVCIQFGGWDWSPESKRALECAMRHADGVVYNSRFGMDDVHARGIRPDCPEAVIHNGCKRMKRASLEHPVFLVACETYDMPAKARALRDAVAGITELRKNIWDAKLWVAGKAPKMEGVDRYLGKVSDQERLAEERSKVAALVHLVEGDQCPNTVVEALAQGIPVLCHANSGTPEVIQWYGQSIGDTTAKKVALELSMIWVRAPAWQSECLKTFDETLRIDRVAKEYGNFLEELKCTNSCS